jgi:small subunit ribosomal protein S20
MRNRVRRSSCRTEVKKLRKAIEAGDPERIRALMPEVTSTLDRTAKVGAIHRNAAARTKSRLSRAARKALGDASSTPSS